MPLTLSSSPTAHHTPQVECYSFGAAFFRRDDLVKWLVAQILGWGQGRLQLWSLFDRLIVVSKGKELHFNARLLNQRGNVGCFDAGP